MICENCKVNIDDKFKAAIKKNKCPACDGEIMPAEKLASLVNLKSLLASNFNNIDIEQIATLIVANFNIKQIFKEELPKVKNESATKEEPNTQSNNEVNDDVLSDEEYKKQQLVEGREMLKNMRDQVLNEAIADQWGLGNANGITDIADIREMADSEKRKQVQENIITGARGSFRRT